MADFTHDASTGRYRNRDTGKFVPNEDIRAIVSTLADDSAQVMRDLSAKLRADQITLEEWQTAMMARIKAGHVAAGVAAHGGKSAMTQADWGYIGHAIRDQYQYLRSFADGIASGDVPLDGRIDSRAAMYGNAAYVMFHDMRARDDSTRGYDEEANVLHASESCDGCISETQAGWVASGELTPIGSRECRSNCKCTIVRRHSAKALNIQRVG